MNRKSRKALREKLLQRKAVIRFAQFCGVSDTAASQWLSGKMNSRNIAAKAVEFEKVIDLECNNVAV